MYMFPSIISIVFTSFIKHLKLPNSTKLPVILWQIVYIYMTAISPSLISWTKLLLSCYLRSCIFFQPLQSVYKMIITSLSNSWEFCRLTFAYSIIQLMHSWEVNTGICQPENSDVHRGEAEVNITFEGWLILMLTEKECTNCFVIWHCLSFPSCI